MKTNIISVLQEMAILQAVEIIKSGGVIAFPTDTVYGIGADVFNENAINKLFEIKGRSSEKSVPVLLSCLEEVSEIAQDIPEIAVTLAQQFWPGPLTLVVPKKPTLSKVISADWTVGVRVPAYTFTLHLLKTVGPLAVTSANLSGHNSSISADQVLEQLDGRIPLLLDGGQSPGGMPSTVVDCTGVEPRILREGPILGSEIAKLLGM